MRKFDIAMCTAWAVITIIYIVLAIAKVDIPAWNAVWPCLICTCDYLDKILDRRNR